MAKKNTTLWKIVGAALAALTVVVVTVVVALSPPQNLRYASAAVLPVDGTNCPGTWDAGSLTCTLNNGSTYLSQFEFTLDGSTLDCNGARILASGGPGAVYAFSKTDVAVKNCEIKNSAGWGVYFATVTDNLGNPNTPLIDNNIFDNTDGAVNLLGGTTDVEVSNNTVLDDPTAPQPAFNIFNSSDNHLHHNTVGDVNQLNGAFKYEFWGFAVDGGSNNNLIENNTASTDKAGAYVGSNATNSGNRFLANTFDNNTNWGMYVVGGVDTEVTGNSMCGNIFDMYIDVAVVPAAIFSSYSNNTGDTIFDNNATGFAFDFACTINECDDTVAHLQGLGYTAYNVNDEIVVVYNEGTPNEVSVTYQTCDAAFIEGTLVIQAELSEATQTEITVQETVVEAVNQDEVEASIVAIANSPSDQGTIEESTPGEVKSTAENTSTGEAKTATVEESTRDEAEQEVLKQSMTGIFSAEGVLQNAVFIEDAIENNLDATVETIDKATGNVIKTASLSFDLDTLDNAAIKDIEPLLRDVVTGIVNGQDYLKDSVSFDPVTENLVAEIDNLDSVSGAVIGHKELSFDKSSLRVPAYQDMPKPLVGHFVTGIVNGQDYLKDSVSFDPVTENLVAEIDNLDSVSGAVIGHKEFAFDVPSLVLMQEDPVGRTDPFELIASFVTGMVNGQDYLKDSVSFDPVANNLIAEVDNLDSVSGAVIGHKEFAFDVPSLVLMQEDPVGRTDPFELIASFVTGMVNGQDYLKDSVSFDPVTENLVAEIDNLDSVSGAVIGHKEFAFDVPSLVLMQEDPVGRTDPFELIASFVTGMVNGQDYLKDSVSFDPVTENLVAEVDNLDSVSGAVIGHKEFAFDVPSLVLMQEDPVGRTDPFELIASFVTGMVNGQDYLKDSVSFDPVTENLVAEVDNLDSVSGAVIGHKEFAFDVPSLVLMQEDPVGRTDPFELIASFVTGMVNGQDYLKDSVSFDPVTENLVAEVDNLDSVSGAVIGHKEFAFDVPSLVLMQEDPVGRTDPFELIASFVTGMVNGQDYLKDSVSFDPVTENLVAEVDNLDSVSGAVIDTTNFAIHQSTMPIDSISAAITGVIDAEIVGESIKMATVSVSDGLPLPPAIVDFQAGDNFATSITIEQEPFLQEPFLRDELLATTVQVASENSDITSTTAISRDATYTQLLVDGTKTIEFENSLLERSVEADYLYTVLTSLYKTVESYDSVIATATVDTFYIAQLIFTVGAETLTVDGGPNVTAEELAQFVYDLFEYGTLDVRCGVRGQEKRACGVNTEVTLHLKSCAVTWSNDPADVVANCASYGSFVEDPNKPADNKFRYYTGSAPYGQYFLVATDPDLLDPMGNPTYSSHPTVNIPEDTFANVIMHVKPDGKNQGMKSKKKTGSELWIYEPTDIVWVNDVEFYPFFFESDSNWTVDVCMEVPEGYEIIEGEECLQTLVANTEKEVMFKVIEVGSIPGKSKLKWEFIGPDGKKIKEKSEVGVKLHPSLANAKKLELLENGYEVDEKGRVKKVK